MGFWVSVWEVKVKINQPAMAETSTNHVTPLLAVRKMKNGNENENKNERKPVTTNASLVVYSCWPVHYARSIAIRSLITSSDCQINCRKHSANTR